MDKLLDPALQTPPLELHRNQLIAAHHRIGCLVPVRANQWTPTGLGRLEL